jgi:hypothetical protein
LAGYQPEEKCSPIYRGENATYEKFFGDFEGGGLCNLCPDIEEKKFQKLTFFCKYKKIVHHILSLFRNIRDVHFLYIQNLNVQDTLNAIRKFSIVYFILIRQMPTIRANGRSLIKPSGSLCW